MLWLIVALLVLLWLLGFLLKIAGALVHALLVVAIAVVVWRMLTRRRAG